MAFDHGAPKIIPLNIVLITMTAFVWSQVISWWIVGPVAALLFLATLDAIYGSMYIALGILIPATLISPHVVRKLETAQTAGNSIAFRQNLVAGLAIIGLAVVVEFGLICVTIWIVEKKIKAETSNKSLNDKENDLPRS